MKIELQGACNARDLGGIQTPYGKIKYGRLLRSGELSRLTAADAQTLRKIGLSRVVDLRTAGEVANTPDVQIDGVSYVNISVVRATTFGITYEKSSGEEIAQMLEAGFERMRLRGENQTEHMQILYRKFVRDEHSRSAYGRFLRLLAEEPQNGATLWHCSAGKDRVGTCTALLLNCLGATKSDIFADYMLTNDQSQQHNLSILNKVRPHVSAENLHIVEEMLGVRQSYLQTFFDEISCMFGDVPAFLANCGVTHAHVVQLRRNYLE